VCDLLVYLNLYGWTICSYYEFASERKFIRPCRNQNQPPNLRLKADIKSTPLTLQRAEESSKGKVTLSEIDTLLSLNIGAQGVQELFFLCEVLEIEAFMVQ